MKHAVTLIRLLFLALFVLLMAQGKTMLWLGLFAVTLLAALLFGRLYCGYVCPLNTLMLPTNWLAKKLRIQTKATPKWLGNGYFAWVALVISIGGMLFLKRAMQINLPLLPIWLAIAVLVTLRYRPAVLHNLICPFGALQKLFGRSVWWATRVDQTACTGCKRCEKVCPSEAIAVAAKKATIDTTLCHQCTSCQQVCKPNAIHYTNQKSKTNAPISIGM